MVENTFDGIILMTKLVTQHTKLALEFIDVHICPLPGCVDGIVKGIG